MFIFFFTDWIVIQNFNKLIYLSKNLVDVRTCILHIFHRRLQEHYLLPRFVWLERKLLNSIKFQMIRLFVSCAGLSLLWKNKRGNTLKIFLGIQAVTGACNQDIFRSVGSNKPAYEELFQFLSPQTPPKTRWQSFSQKKKD